MVKSHEKKMSKLFSCGYYKPLRNVAEIIILKRWILSIQQKKDGFWLLWGIFKKYIKQNIIMAVLRKANSYSVADWKAMKNNHENQGDIVLKMFFTFIFLLLILTFRTISVPQVKVNIRETERNETFEIFQLLTLKG